MTQPHTHIQSQHRLFDLNLKEVWNYRELILLFTKRSFKVAYAQTILGPMWLLLKPLMSSLIYVVLFGNIARLSTGGVPQLLFYFIGTTLWGFFSACATENATVFSGFSRLFGKVYFPRLVIPISHIFSIFIRFGIQMLFTLALLVYYTCTRAVSPNPLACLLIPVVLIQLALLGTGVGLIITSLTTRYKDLAVLISFGFQLWMYATPVVYPHSAVPAALQPCIAYNPATLGMECFRMALTGTGTLTPPMVLSACCCTLVVALLGVLLFKKAERTFVDTI